MTGLEYERHVAQYLSQHGYSNVKVTKGSGDYGVDVIAHKHGKKYAVQCKLYSGSVGLSAVQEAVAGKAMYGCDSAMVVTNSYFTKAAFELANANDVVLIEGVRAGKNKGLPKWIRVSIAIAYLFITSAIIAAAIEQAKSQPFGRAIYNLLLTLLFITSPFWIYFGSKYLIRYVRNRHNSKNKNPSATPIKKDQLVKQAEPIRRIKPKSFARPEIIKRYLPDDTVNADTVALLLSEIEQVTVSTVQRQCKFGCVKATRIINVLVDNELLTEIQNFTYVWTEKAKKPLC